MSEYQKYRYLQNKFWTSIETLNEAEEFAKENNLDIPVNDLRRSMEFLNNLDNIIETRIWNGEIVDDRNHN